MLNIIDGLTYDDVLLVPKYSTIDSRSMVDTSIKIETKTGEIFVFETPFIPANMASIAGIDMVKVMYEHKSLGLLHRFMPFEEQLAFLKEVKSWEDGTNYIGFSIGIQKEDYERADQFVKNGAKILCIDVANADCFMAIELAKYIANEYPEILLICGTVGMGGGAKRLWSVGVDFVRVGIGGGSICTTRVNTGCGVPMLTAISDCYSAKLEMQRVLGRNLYFIADGGLSTSGNVAKALTFADAVMLGNMFSGCDEAAGSTIEIDGKQFKSYVGSSTLKSTHKEGVEALVTPKGPAKEIIKKLSEGLRSCCSYQNVQNLEDLKKDPQFVKITNAGLKESGAHDVILPEQLKNHANKY